MMTVFLHIHRYSTGNLVLPCQIEAKTKSCIQVFNSNSFGTDNLKLFHMVRLKINIKSKNIIRILQFEWDVRDKAQITSICICLAFKLRTNILTNHDD